MIPAVNSVNAGNRTREHQARCSRPYLTEQDSDIKNVTGRTSNFSTKYIGGKYLSHLSLLFGLFFFFQNQFLSLFSSIVSCLDSRSCLRSQLGTISNIHSRRKCARVFFHLLL
ncbi:putative programmed cell death protein [Clavispora lusitaniae]|uniref:Programmed cell death protein n=1 Tax=Clavispora lusitaniae TaxID=36911 RepID=A0ACD0WG19_CLALS|nr:hypothetical protein FOB63_001051 [Clavispora lusitaniae]QFZ26017.1 putative programmed cell death protein [Clavispora lusitaniae]QFZ30680.1 putative programmed cell death protein [Clavispora lusitaniae]QFZ36348.1 putative programmed cell death protein [Clavispora lusitaniae]QFZ42032.1 putative programmed cell death protein [Clavispora lusitaniae]